MYAVLVICAVSSAIAETPFKPTAVHRGAQSQVVKRRFQLIEHETAWKKLWADHRGKVATPDFKVDFDKQVISLEEAPSQYLVPKTPDHPPSEREKEEEAKKEKDTFHPVADLMPKPMELPEGLKVIEVKSARYKKPATDGVAYVYFFNNGNTDGATIYFETDQKVHQAIFVHPITGMTRIDGVGPEDKQ